MIIQAFVENISEYSPTLILAIERQRIFIYVTYALNDDNYKTI